MAKAFMLISFARNEINATRNAMAFELNEAVQSALSISGDPKLQDESSPIGKNDDLAQPSQEEYSIYEEIRVEEARTHPEAAWTSRRGACPCARSTSVVP